MITQALKRWLHKMFAWWPWGKAPEEDYEQIGTSLNTGMSHDAMARPFMEGTKPPSGVAPLILGQGETSCSTIDDWPDRAIPPIPPEKTELPYTPLPRPPVTPAISWNNEATPERIPGKDRAIFPDIPQTPAVEKQMEFLQYLVRRGIINEGFAEEEVPEQYRRLRR